MTEPVKATRHARELANHIAAVWGVPAERILRESLILRADSRRAVRKHDVEAWVGINSPAGAEECE